MKKEKIVAIPAALLMTALLAFPAMASEKIEEVTIDINAVLTDSDNLEVEADVSDDGCYVDEISITNEPNGDWNDDTKPKVKITIGAESDYAFSSGLSKSDVYLGNDEQKVTSVTRSTSKLYVYVTLQQISDIDSEYDDEDYDLDVYDLVTDSVRDVKSLSGGESFMAALSMALGLADIIQNTAGAVSLETMFVDEGFGSLDDASRDRAIQILKELAGEKGLVGIISHVNELKEQIDWKLNITKTEHGSQAKWEI